MGEEKKFGIPKPVSVGDTVDVLIEGQGGQGDGIAKIESFVVFVKGARRGERCSVKITDVKRTFATGEKVGPAKAGAAPEKESAEEMAEETEGDHDGPSG
jgi:predicted RNA-binding protein with TRAM domain